MANNSQGILMLFYENLSKLKCQYKMGIFVAISLKFIVFDVILASEISPLPCWQ